MPSILLLKTRNCTSLYSELYFERRDLYAELKLVLRTYTVLGASKLRVKRSQARQLLLCRQPSKQPEPILVVSQY